MNVLPVQHAPLWNSAMVWCAGVPRCSFSVKFVHENWHLHSGTLLAVMLTSVRRDKKKLDCRFEDDMEYGHERLILWPVFDDGDFGVLTPHPCGGHIAPGT